MNDGVRPTTAGLHQRAGQAGSFQPRSADGQARRAAGEAPRILRCLLPSRNADAREATAAAGSPRGCCRVAQALLQYHISPDVLLEPNAAGVGTLNTLYSNKALNVRAE
jgi:hypothetical protein